MKIDGHAHQHALTQTGRAADDHATRDAARRQTSSATDQVSLSTDAQLLAKAVAKANEIPEIRQDRVAQARLKLESGELGQDTEALAESIIDHLVE